MSSLLEKTRKYIGPELRMPWWLFWSILLSITWFYLVRRVISWDLWWHMAAGRYLLEHGYYPPNDTFTFSPVTGTDFTSKTWFGDIVLHLTYDWFGFYGLQFLRASFIISGVLFMLHLVKFRYNIWTLLVSSMMIIGTMQKHLIKNAIIIIPAMSFITWTWVQIKYHKNYKWIYAYPILFMLWKPFHGSVMVGACFLFAIWLGEFLDCLISIIIEHYRKESSINFFGGKVQYLVTVVASSILFIPLFFAFIGILTLIIALLYSFGQNNLPSGMAGIVMAALSYIFAIWVGKYLLNFIANSMNYLSKIKFRNFFGNFQYLFYTVILLTLLIAPINITVAASIGLALIFLYLFIIGYHTFPDPQEYLNKIVSNRSSLGFFIKLTLICFPIFIYVHANYRLPMLNPANSMFSSMALFGESKAKSANKEQEKKVVKASAPKKSTRKSTTQKFAENFSKVFDESKPLKARLKDFFRIVFGGTDAKLVAEYQWPFEILYVLSVKSLFLMVVIYSCYVIFRLSIGVFDIKLSFELPSLALIYLSLGYLRTLSYPFASAVIFFTFSIAYCFPYFERGNRKLKGWIILLHVLFLFFLWLFSPLFSEFVKLFFDALKDATEAKNARYLAIPILLLPLTIGVLLTLKNTKHFKMGYNILLSSIGVYTLSCLLYFSYYQNKTYQDGNFHTVTGFLDTEPGLGKSNKFFDGMADLVQSELPPKNIYNSYNMGGYLLWKWYGERQVFIDGRSIIYEKDFYQAYTTNNAQQYIIKEDLEHAILNMVVDKDRILIFSKQGWYPIHFDPGMTILKKPKKYGDSFGVLPKFHEGERAIEDLENLDRLALAEFINTSVHHMMLYGRIKDAHDFMVNSKDIIAKIPEANKKLNERLNHIKLVGQNFGFHNHPSMAELSKKIFNKVQGAEYHYAMGEAHYALKQYPKAEGQYGRAYQMKKDDPKTLKRLGEVLFLNKKHQNAVSILVQAIKANEKDPVLHNLLMLPFIELKQYDKALVAGQNALKLNPNFAEAYFNIGRVHLLQNKANLAIPHFQKALQIKPNFVEAQNIMKQIEAKIIEQQAAQKAKEAANNKTPAPKTTPAPKK